ncbi:protein transporter tim9 [Coelomomyces lativittatus]|nr:protein transporter tim9 [Coelomomyces lativittatus]
MIYGGRASKRKMKDFFKMYTNLVDRCFTDCVHGFTSSALSGKEDSCLTKCVDKYLRHTERVSLRFAEQNLQLQQQHMSTEN